MGGKGCGAKGVEYFRMWMEEAKGNSGGSVDGQGRLILRPTSPKALKGGVQGRCEGGKGGEMYGSGTVSFGPQLQGDAVDCGGVGGKQLVKEFLEGRVLRRSSGEGKPNVHRQGWVLRAAEASTVSPGGASQLFQRDQASLKRVLGVQSVVEGFDGGARNGPLQKGESAGKQNWNCVRGEGGRVVRGEPHFPLPACQEGGNDLGCFGSDFARFDDQSNPRRTVFALLPPQKEGVRGFSGEDSKGVCVVGSHGVPVSQVGNLAQMTSGCQMGRR